MDTQADFQVIVNHKPVMTIIPSFDMTLDELKTVEDSYKQIAAADYNDLLSIVLALGEKHRVGHYQIMTFSTQRVTINHSLRTGLYDTHRQAYTYFHNIGISTGQAIHVADDGAIIRRDTTVCWLVGLECAGENKPIIGLDTFYRPGLWRGELFENLHRAHVVINARKNDKTEQERIALAERLLAGITI